VDTHHSLIIFCVSDSLVPSVKSSYITDSGENMSDHLPLHLVLDLPVSVSEPTPQSPSLSQRLRWDKADLVGYYYGTYSRLKDISFDMI